MIDLTRLTRKSGDYAFGPRGAVTDRVLLEVAENCEIEVSNRFIAIKPANLAARYGPDNRPGRPHSSGLLSIPIPAAAAGDFLPMAVVRNDPIPVQYKTDFQVWGG